jgi:hypothetical protein
MQIIAKTAPTPFLHLMVLSSCFRIAAQKVLALLEGQDWVRVKAFSDFGVRWLDTALIATWHARPNIRFALSSRSETVALSLLEPTEVGTTNRFSLEPLGATRRRVENCQNVAWRDELARITPTAPAATGSLISNALSASDQSISDEQFGVHASA